MNRGSSRESAACWDVKIRVAGAWPGASRSRRAGLTPCAQLDDADRHRQELARVTPNEIIANQKLILDSQERIEVYQRKVDELLSAQVAIIESQRRMQVVINENQRRLRENQEKLDALLATQEIIQANQAKILANQAEIISLLC
jgi:uncharacterized protein (DUF2344 family)